MTVKEITIDGVSIKMYREHDLVINDYERDGNTFEDNSLKYWIKKCREKESTVLDIGAYTGIYSLIAGKINKHQVIAFEPVPDIALRFSENISLNKLNNIYLVKGGVGKCNETIDIYTNINLRYPTASSVFNLRRGYNKIIQTKMYSLDYLFSGFDVFPDYLKISMIKIDVEGYECEVIEGGIKVITGMRPVMIIEILNSENFKIISGLLNHMNYKIEFLDPRDGEKGFQAGNYLFV